MKIVRQSLAILLITFALTEIAFRTYNYFEPSFIFQDFSYNRFRGKPNAPDYDFHLNSKGFKDVEFQPEKAPGSYRIVALGDSCAFGVVPYEHNYLTLLEENLNRTGRKTEIINMGIVSTGSRDYLALLAKEGLPLKPDMVLVSFFIGNDFDRGEVRSLYSYSYVASFIHYLISVNRSYEGQVVHGAAVYDDNAPSLSEQSFIDLESRRSEIYRKQNTAFRADFEAALKSLTDIKRLCGDYQIELVIALIPDNVQVDQGLQARVLRLKEGNSGSEDFDFELPNRLLATSLKEQNIVFIDLLGDFASKAAQNPLYKPRDTHWNIAGNRVAAVALARELSRFLPGPSSPPSNGTNTPSR